MHARPRPRRRVCLSNNIPGRWDSLTQLVAREMVRGAESLMAGEPRGGGAHVTSVLTERTAGMTNGGHYRPFGTEVIRLIRPEW